jgi:hypothetical protein
MRRFLQHHTVGRGCQVPPLHRMPALDQGSRRLTHAQADPICSMKVAHIATG